MEWFDYFQPLIYAAAVAIFSVTKHYLITFMKDAARLAKKRFLQDKLTLQTAALPANGKTAMPASKPVTLSSKMLTALKVWMKRSKLA